MTGNAGYTGESRRQSLVGVAAEPQHPLSEMQTARREVQQPLRSIPALRVLHLIAYGNLAGTEISTARLAAGQLARGFQPIVAILYQGGPIEEILHREGIPVIRIDAMNGRAHLALRRLAGTIHTVKPDVLHAHDLRWWSAVVGRFAHQGPRLLTIHHQMVVGATGWRWRLKYRIARWCYEGFSAVSTATLRSVTEAVPLSPQRCAVIPNGISVESLRAKTSRTESKRRYGCNPEDPLVGFVGRLSAEKGVDDFLRTCREVMRLEPRARFWVIGDGEQAAELGALARALGLQGHVAFWGSRLDVAEMFPAMDALLLTSHRETFGLVLLEAMAAEVPILGFVPAEGGVLEVVPGPEVARLLPERNTVRLAELVVEALRTEAVRNGLTRTALQHVQRSFTLERITEQYLQLYLQFLERVGES